jgi:small nuclear ribonucleoprotein (snRNP)-like protein
MELVKQKLIIRLTKSKTFTAVLSDADQAMLLTE